MHHLTKKNVWAYFIGLESGTIYRPTEMKFESDKFPLKSSSQLTMRQKQTDPVGKFSHQVASLEDYNYATSRNWSAILLVLHVQNFHAFIAKL